MQQRQRQPGAAATPHTHLTALFVQRLSADSVGLSLGMRLPQRAPWTSFDQQRPSACTYGRAEHGCSVGGCANNAELGNTAGCSGTEGCSRMAWMQQA